jgi:hypothetical protein
MSQWSQLESRREQSARSGVLQAVVALIDDVGVGTEFEDHLTAGAARRTRGVVAVEDGDGANPEGDAFSGDASGDGRALGAHGQAVRSIFDIATGIDRAGSGKHSGADVELGIRSIGPGKHIAGCDEKALLVPGGQRRGGGDPRLNTRHVKWSVRRIKGELRLFFKRCPIQAHRFFDMRHKIQNLKYNDFRVS